MKRLVVALLLLAGCEKDTVKYERLHQRLLIAELAVELDQRARERGEAVCPEFAKLPTADYMARCDSAVREHQTTLGLAQRDFNTFMGGGK